MVARFQVKVIGQGGGLEAQQLQDLLAVFRLQELAAPAPKASQAGMPPGPAGARGPSHPRPDHRAGVNRPGARSMGTVLERMEHLPRRNFTVLTVKAIGGLAGGFQTITSADALSRARHGGYGRALSLDAAINRSQKASGGLRVLANGTGGLPLVKRMAQLVPPKDTLQAVDLNLKVAAEMHAFTRVNGLPGDSFADVAAALQNDAGGAKLRMAALLCFDALLPLGDQALQRQEGLLAGVSGRDLRQVPAAAGMAGLIASRGDEAHLSFLRQGVRTWLGWAGRRRHRHAWAQRSAGVAGPGRNPGPLARQRRGAGRLSGRLHRDRPAHRRAGRGRAPGGTGAAEI